MRGNDGMNNAKEEKEQRTDADLQEAAERKIKPLAGAPKVLVTGVSSGIGKATAELFARGGYEVYGVSRSVKPGSRRYKRGGILRYLPMDVTDDDSVRRVMAKIGPLDILVLAAGMGIAGSAEEVPIDLVKRQMDVNYYGVLRVVSAALPPMRERMYGKIIIVGSLGGRVAIPMQSHYSSSKYALEAYTDALRIELKPYDIDVSIIEPGDTKTGFTANRETFLPEDSVYKDAVEHAVKVMARDEMNGDPAENVAMAILKCSKSDHPKAHIICGRSCKLAGFALKHLPDRVREYAVRKLYMTDHGED